MRTTTNNIISVICSFMRFALVKLIHAKGLKLYWIQRFSPDVVFEMSKTSQVNLGKRIRVHSGGKIKVRNNANLDIGDNTAFNYNCILVCHSNIKIGKNVIFGPGVYIFDHDHKYSVNSACIRKNGFDKGIIVIGDNVWVGANTVILKDTVIGNNCVIGAGSVIKGHYKENTCVIQKRQEIEKAI